MLGALIGGIASLAGGAMASSGAKKAAKAQAKADQAAINEQRRQFDIAQRNQDPYLQGGVSAYNQLLRMYGLPTQNLAPMPDPSMYQSQGSSITDLLNGPRDLLNGLNGNKNQFTNYGPGQAESVKMDLTQGTPSGPDFSAFYNSPDYQFNMSEGLKGVEGSAAAGGGLYSGRNLRALQETGAGIASNQFNNYTNRLASLAGIGQTAATNLGGLGAQYAGNIGSLLSNQGNARASGIAGSANAWGNAFGTLGSIGQDWWNNRQLGPVSTAGLDPYRR